MRSEGIDALLDGLGVECDVWVGGATAEVVGEALRDLRSRRRTRESGDLILIFKVL